MSSRRGCGLELKLDQIALTTSRSSTAIASRDYIRMKESGVKGEKERKESVNFHSHAKVEGGVVRATFYSRQRDEYVCGMRTFCNFRLYPSSAILWWRTHSFRAGGCGGASGNRLGPARGCRCCSPRLSEAAPGSSADDSASLSGGERSAARTSSAVTTWKDDVSASSSGSWAATGLGARDRGRPGLRT